jgi:hypothetical protein
MALLENELARREGAAVALREGALRVRWTFDGLRSSDGHDLSCTFAASVQAIPDKVERRMLAEVLLADRPAATSQDVAEHFQRALQTAAAGAAQHLTATALVAGEPAAKSAMLDALRKAGGEVAFNCGVELLPPFTIECHSDSLQRQQLRAMQQTLIERQHAGELEQLQRAAELLEQFETIRGRAPNLSAGQVLAQINPADRGSMLRSLLLASAQQADGRCPALWAVAGPSLMRIEATDATAQPKLFTLPTDLGPLRSVHPAEIDSAPALLIGAQRGFFLVRPDDPAATKTFAYPGLESSLGFNRILHAGPDRGFFGTHGEAGLVHWPAGENPRVLYRGGAPRHLNLLDATRLLFSVGPQSFVLSGEAVEPIGEARGEIVGILKTAGGFIIIREDGGIERLDPHSMQIDRLQQRGSRLRTAGALPWLDSQRLLLATEDGPIVALGLDDQLVTEYLSVHRGFRMVCGCPAAVAAVSPDRQRVLIWNSWDGRQPARELYITSLTRHRVAHVAFAT